MKKHLSIGLVVLAFITLAGCSKTRYGQLTGVNPPGKWTETAPIGMNFIHQGSFRLGPKEQEATNSMCRNSFSRKNGIPKIPFIRIISRY